MADIKRYQGNPIFTPNEDVTWEGTATFNGCVLKDGKTFHLVYRAQSYTQRYFDQDMEIATVGYAQSTDGIHFENRRPLITPEYKWEQFGCEDPRITKIDDKYYIFYTALGDYPPTPEGIKLGVAITHDFKKIEEKHQATFFNSKAMALFPEKINGKLAALLTVNTDRPPAKIALAYFNDEAQIWNKDYWDKWIRSLNRNSLFLLRSENDQVELGAPPIKTDKGWLIVYCYIENYFTKPTFSVEAALLDLENPLTVIGRTSGPILTPKEEYEIYGKVPKIVFPSGSLVLGDELFLYYGAADTTCCLGKINIKELLDDILYKKDKTAFLVKKNSQLRLTKYSGNPIIKPRLNLDWESFAILNPAAIYLDGKVHILYRAMSRDGTSTLGYAGSRDGYTIDERLDYPVYTPRESFEIKRSSFGFSGCEDPRISQIGDTLYMCYTAYDSENPTTVALSSIKVSDFLAKKWDWTKPIVISYADRSDKNACVFPEIINGQYVFFHRIGGCIWIDFVDNLKFSTDRKLGGNILASPRPDSWDSKKIGIAGPPIKTELGWLLIYHGLSETDLKYRLSAMLLDLKKPDDILMRLKDPILEPGEFYEMEGVRPDTVFSCGSVVIGDTLFVYYGAGDIVIGVASIKLSTLLNEFKQNLP